MSTYNNILALERSLENAKSDYLKRYGWKQTCSTPGSYWLWRRDFADVDMRRQAIIEERKMPRAHVPYGVITVPLDLAVTMTMKELDTEDEGQEG